MFAQLYCTSEMLFRVFFFIHGGSKGEHALNMAKVGLLRIVLKHDNGGLNVRQRSFTVSIRFSLVSYSVIVSAQIVRPWLTVYREFVIQDTGKCPLSILTRVNF